MTEQEWRDALKVGDEVIVQTTDRCFLLKVTRTTATQVNVNHDRFARSTGKQIGGRAYRPHYIHRPTPEVVAKIRDREERDRLYARIANLRHWTPTETMRAMVALLDEATNARAEEARAE